MVSAAKANAKSIIKDFDAIIVHKFDRFARSREDSVVYKSLLRKECGVRVISVTENIDDDKFSVILEAMLEAMAEYYSINLAEEVKKGMTEKALRGEPLTIPPFGYKMEDKRLISHPEQAEIIKQVFDSFLEGQGYMQIAKHLNNLGLRTNRGSKFENRTIEYILRNPVYTGKIRWNPKCRTRRNYDDESLLIVQGSHEPIITEEIFLKAQKRVMEIKEQYTKHSKAQSASHWLVGLLKCSSCGKGLVKNGSAYFQCRAYVGGKCNLSHLLSIKDAEENILKQMERDATSAEPLTVNISGKTSNNNSYTQKQINALERKLERIKEAYTAGVDTLEEYKSNKERLTNEIEQLKSQLESIQSADESDNINRPNLLNAVSQLRSELTTAEKKIIAHNAIHHILYDKPNKTLYIVYNNK